LVSLHRIIRSRPQTQLTACRGSRLRSAAVRICV
jgi:hypothetical protein